MPELRAPAGWRRVELISDVHLQAREPATFEAWRRFMSACDADALFILGDLFEVWEGDDAASEAGFAADCVSLLAATAQRLPVHFMHGNRDFLVGDGFAAATGVQLLKDPTVLAFGGRRWLLSHGDALCLADLEYQAFRSRVRDPAWQREILSRPLQERRALGRALREQSAARGGTAATYADVDADAAVAWLRSAGADTLIHGHTHRPGEHALADGLRRVVLSDWDAEAQPPRLEVLRLTEAGAERLPWA